MKTIILNKEQTVNELSVICKTQEQEGKMTFILATLSCSDSLGPVMTFYKKDFNRGDNEMSKS
jgi:hypothetical protein